MTIGSPIALCIALLLVITSIIVARMRRIAMPAFAGTSVALGTLLLALAAGRIIITLPQEREVVVMIDQSASTRGAAYRDRAELNDRIRQLIGDVPHRLQEFSDDASEQTIYRPLSADAVLLFSDARFELPATAPPTYVVIDPNLEHPSDAAVAGLEARGDSVMTNIRHFGPPRELQINGALDTPAISISSDQFITARLDAAAVVVSARISQGDLWPENDALSLHPAPPPQAERWWIGPGAPSSQWQVMQPHQLPDDPAAYLRPSVIVLQNIPADALSSSQQDRLAQFVRDLGGGLVIAGGDHAFAAGNYPGSVIESLSPLASNPPGPQRNWILLVDASGSMAAAAEVGVTRWQRAADAMAQLLRNLPPEDGVSIGSFARNVRWWSQGRSTADTLKLALPPRDITPQGPTNLQDALQSIASQLAAGARTEIIIISDGDAAIDDPQKLSSALSAVTARVHLLATADASRAPLASVVGLTRGILATQADPRLWADASKQILRAVSPDRLERSATAIQFENELASLPARATDLMNRTWLKRGATQVASTPILGGASLAIAAYWRNGAGGAAAMAFPANAAEIEAISQVVARPPRDPRFILSWTASQKLTVRLNAMENDRYLNDLDVTLILGDEAASSRNVRTSKLAQTAPGQYETAILPPRRPSLASVRVGDRIIDRFAVAGRYAPEYDGIGNDHQAMQSLARLSGGAIIDPTQTTPIDFKFPLRRVSLTSQLASLGATLIAVGLLLWKHSS